MDWGTATLLGGLWLGGLSLGLALLWARVTRLQAAQASLALGLEQIRAELRGLRRDLGGVAGRQQVADLRGQLVADLRPIIAEAVALHVAARPHGGRGRQVGVAFAGSATVVGPVAGGDVGARRPGEEG